MQHRNTMLRVAPFVVAVCLCASAVAWADTSPDRTQTPPAAEIEARFESFVEMGDRARLAGRYDEAATAYNAALEIHRHPAVRGRLGLVLVKLGHIDKAAEELHEAVERGQGVALQERREVGAAYDKAKSATTWVTVNVSHLGAVVTCDGVPWAKGLAAFWRFAMPGEHTLRASLDGYEDAVATFTGKPGEEITVSLRLVRRIEIIVPDPNEALLEQLKRHKRIFPPPLPTSNDPKDSNYNPREDPFSPLYPDPKETTPVDKKTGMRFSVMAGVVTVFGVASWNPAVGPVVGVGLRPKEWLSFGLEGRAAWLTTGVGGGQINAMTVGGNLAACGHVRWFFGCALGHLGTIAVESSEKSYNDETLTFIKPGFGGRLGADVRVGSRILLRPSVEVLRLRSGTTLVAGGKVVADQPALLLSGQLSGAWEF